MSNYSKSVDFAAKDDLPRGNAAKIISGTEIDAEFVAIRTAVNSKANLASPDLTGTPTAPTASAGTNSTQIATAAFVQAQKASPAFTGTPTAPTATLGTDTTQVATTAFVQAALAAVYPVGSIYSNATNSTNPATLLGFGTWQAFGDGKVMVGIKSDDTDFDTAEETGGFKEVTLTAAQSGLPAHDHFIANGDALFGTYVSSTNHMASTNNRDSRSAYALVGSSTTPDRGLTSEAAAADASSAHTNLQPYIVVYMWKRIA